MTVSTLESTAAEAAQASKDAHGFRIKADQAYDFIRNTLYEAEDARYDDMPAEMPIEWAWQYYSDQEAQA